jgi:hypothetical protein
MKKLVAVAVLLGVAFAAQAADKKVVEPAKAGISATVTLAEDGNQLWARVKIAGVEAGKTVSPIIRWTAPEVTYTVAKGETKGETFKIFADSEYKSPPVRTKTKAYRTLETEVNGKTVRALGVWKVEVVVDGAVIGSATYEVKG